MEVQSGGIRVAAEERNRFPSPECHERSRVLVLLLDGGVELPDGRAEWRDGETEGGEEGGRGTDRPQQGLS